MEIFMWLLFVIIDWLVYFALHQGELKSSLYNIKLFRFNNSIWFTSGYGQDKKFWCDGVEHISLCSCRDGGTGTTWPKHSERWRNFWRCTLWSLWWLNLGALLVHTPDNCHFSHQRILHLIFFSIDNFMPMSFLHLFSKRAKYALVFSSFSQVFSTCLRQLSGMPWSFPRLLIPQSLGRDRDSWQTTWEDVWKFFIILWK